MHLRVAAVGRLKAGAERDLFERYVERAGQAARSLGFRGPAVSEIAEHKAARADERRERESSALLTGLTGSYRLIALDERGKQISSVQFAELLRDARDEGVREMVFAIGGPDGHHRSLVDRADRVIGLGALTWPHMLARIMLAEQLYRAMTILSGHPYHRA